MTEIDHPTTDAYYQDERWAINRAFVHARRAILWSDAATIATYTDLFEHQLEATIPPLRELHTTDPNGIDDREADQRGLGRWSE